MENSIHPTAIIEDGATLGEGVKVGPYCVVAATVSLGDNVELKSHVVVEGSTQIGAGTVIFPFAVIGSMTQDKKYKQGEPAKLVIGRNNVIREHVTMNPGHTEPHKMTKIGDNCLFMVASHVAHDCIVGDNVIMANNATLAGHVEVGDCAILGGLSAVRQFVRIGSYAMIGGMSGVEHDVIPYGTVMGERAKLSGLNIVGMKRNGFEREQIHRLRQAYRQLFANEGTMNERLADVADQFADDEVVQGLLKFIQGESSIGLCQPTANQNYESKQSA